MAGTFPSNIKNAATSQRLG